MKKQTHFLLSLALLSSTLSLTACDKIAEKATEAAMEKAIESQTGEKVEIDTSSDGEITIKTESGTLTASDESSEYTLKDADGSVQAIAGESIEIPSDFPADVPLPDNFQANSSMKLEKDSFMLMGNAQGTMNALQKQLKQELTSEGWKEIQSFNSPDNIQIGLEKNERQLSYTIQAEDQKTVSVMVVVAQKS